MVHRSLASGPFTRGPKAVAILKRSTPGIHLSLKSSVSSAEAGKALSRAIWVSLWSGLIHIPSSLTHIHLL
jgi:hypothetical protein